MQNGGKMLWVLGRRIFAAFGRIWQLSCHRERRIGTCPSLYPGKMLVEFGSAALVTIITTASLVSCKSNAKAAGKRTAKSGLKATKRNAKSKNMEFTFEDASFKDSSSIMAKSGRAVQKRRSKTDEGSLQKSVSIASQDDRQHKEASYICLGVVKPAQPQQKFPRCSSTLSSGATPQATDDSLRSGPFDRSEDRKSSVNYENLPPAGLRKSRVDEYEPLTPFANVVSPGTTPFRLAPKIDNDSCLRPLKLSVTVPGGNCGTQDSVRFQRVF
ncbi:hypothetical protein QR680_012183 [Steinernema hermaphroditum]|uniref:Uncharacterized protein n=1 Tax=Steinernema hermaphroditum TaxID=289476 RepID=A0AA39I173_9BILA|nr:hypothetical protein QR680_012183 [Steinernema hermaphroditum]